MSDGTIGCPYARYFRIVIKSIFEGLCEADVPPPERCSYVGPDGPCPVTFSIARTQPGRSSREWEVAQIAPDGSPTTMCQERTDNLEIFGQELLTRAELQRRRALEEGE